MGGREEKEQVKPTFLEIWLGLKKQQSKGFKNKEGSTTKTNSLKYYWD